MPRIASSIRGGRGSRPATEAHVWAVQVARSQAQAGSTVSQVTPSASSVSGRTPRAAEGESTTRADRRRAAAVASTISRFSRGRRCETSAISGTRRRLSGKPMRSGSSRRPWIALAWSSGYSARKGPASSPAPLATAARRARYYQYPVVCSAAPLGSATEAPRRYATSSRSSISALLVGKVWIVEPRYGCVIGAAQQHTTQLVARGVDPPGE